MRSGKAFAVLVGITVVMVLLPYFSAIAEEKSKEKQDLDEVDFHRFFPVLGHNFTRGLFSTDNIVPFYLGAIGAGTVGHWDQQISRKLRGNAKLAGNVGNIGGSPLVFAATGASLIALHFTESKRFRAFTFDLTQGLILDFTMVTVLKNTVHRTRPDLRNKVSFPSGHAADAFLIASILDHHYGKKIGIPAYAFATFVAYSRIEKGKHFPSDVVFGATLGYIAGRTAIAGRIHDQKKKIAFAPYFGGNSAGVSIILR